MYSDGPTVVAVPAGVAGTALFAPSQIALGLVILASVLLVLGILTLSRSRRLAKS